MKMDVNVGLPKAAIVAVAAFAVIVVLLLAWIGGESHYRGCLEKVALEHPATARVEPAQDAAREDAVSDCSRWP